MFEGQFDDRGCSTDHKVQMSLESAETVWAEDYTSENEINVESWWS